MAAGLTALMILLFLGNWRLTLIILASIPLSIITAVLVMYVGGQTLNTMTLGGFALAVGILVDNGTVVIENIERHVRLGEPLDEAIINGAGEVGVPTFLSTLCICIVFVPVFLLQGTAKYLFSPLSLSVCVSLLASLVLSFTLVPVLFKYLMRSQSRSRTHVAARTAARRPARRAWQPQSVHARSIAASNAASSASATAIATRWPGRCREPLRTVAFFAAADGLSRCCCFPRSGGISFRRSMPGRCGCTCARRRGRGIEQTQADFAQVEAAIREIVGNEQIDVILDNIGLPYSGINIALSDSATVGPMDGEILISLKPKHTPTAELVAELRRELPQRFPELQFFFQPADIVDQVLNFGQPAPIDIRVSGPNSDADLCAGRPKLARDLQRVPGIVDAHVFQVPDAPGAERRCRSGAGDADGAAAACHRQQCAGHDQLAAPRPRRISGSIRATASAIRWSCRCRPTTSIRTQDLWTHAA